ncbi:M23 family metallopeptidase [Arthrobacter sp. FW306-05-C]|uniref:M23 family metallopeptidase n=1 Tax=Arthrobacter sp. FW306-05-C TaxID=2879620 RepID=UPI001F2D8BA0|nr:M23 family metallopeptidase [Arthrobacter sp. FW306-05-C]UKA68393.1 M23 family metallopeptidase [Arthrobacter sp. FW306-05-C]
MVAFTALSAGHADSGPVVTAIVPPAAGTGPVAEAPVTAAAGVALTFDRSPVTSQPAAEPPKVEPAEAAPAMAAVTGPQSLRAPLSSINVTSPFGFRVSPITGAAAELHTGIDLASACSTAVFAAGSGTVVEAGWSPYGSGNRIVVDHGNGLKSTYNHLASVGVFLGQALAPGQQIAGVGTTGASTGCHLHFEVVINDRTVNPAPYL